MECPQNLDDMLKQADLFSMAAHELMNHARKHQHASFQAWLAYIFLASNYKISYVDASGALRRRTALFPFKNPVTTVDTSMQQKLETERGVIMMRCMQKYRNETSGEKKGLGWWSIVHPDLAKLADEMAKDACPIKNFLKNGSSRMQCLHEDGAITNLEFFNTRLKTHLKYANISYTPTSVAVEQALSSEGFVIREVQVCKVCSQPCKVANCGGHYNPKNRRP
jgi:hypothetical protein